MMAAPLVIMLHVSPEFSILSVSSGEQMLQRFVQSHCCAASVKIVTGI